MIGLSNYFGLGFTTLNWKVLWHCLRYDNCFIVNRGPNKRQIKPAENNSLLQLALGEDSEESEEDEDFELNDDDDDEGVWKKIPLCVF